MRGRKLYSITFILLFLFLFSIPHLSLADTMILGFSGEVTRIDEFEYSPWDESDQIGSKYVSEPIQFLAKFKNKVTDADRESLRTHTFFGDPVVDVKTNFQFPSINSEIRGNPFRYPYIESDSMQISTTETDYGWQQSSSVSINRDLVGHYRGDDYHYALEIDMYGSGDFHDGNLKPITAPEFENILEEMADDKTNFGFEVHHYNPTDRDENSFLYYGDVKLEQVTSVNEILLNQAKYAGKISAFTLEAWLLAHGVGFGPEYTSLPEDFFRPMRELNEWITGNENEKITMFAGLSPIDIALMDKDGNVYDKMTDPDDRFLYLEGDFFEEGNLADLIFIRDLDGNVKLNILPEEGVADDDIFSMLVSEILGDQITTKGLFEDALVANGHCITIDTDNSFEYVTNNAPVPEPSTMLLLSSGLIGLAGYGRRKFKKR